MTVEFSNTGVSVWNGIQIGIQEEHLKHLPIHLIKVNATTAFLITNDVRTDGILTGLVIFSVWQLSAFLRHTHIRHLLFGGFKVSSHTEYITFSGFMLSFLALSASGYKLPHYIFPLFPFIAVITSHYIFSLSEASKQLLTRFTKAHFGILHVFFIAPVISFIYFFPPHSVFLPVILGILFLLFWYSFKSIQGQVDKVGMLTLIQAFAFGLVLSTYFYSSLLEYQSESKVGKEIYERKAPDDRFYFYNTHAYSLDFYARRIVPGARLDEMNSYTKGTLIFTDQG